MVVCCYPLVYRTAASFVDIYLVSPTHEVGARRRAGGRM